LYHAGAVFASNYLVTLQRAAIRLGVPAAGIVPLMRGTIDHGFELTGPIARGDRATVEAHQRAIQAEHPELEQLYEPLAEATAAEGVDLVFAPTAEELYPPCFATWVDPGETGAEGAARPGHFRGVATVCLKLFELVRPERAYFGQKDAQQLAVIRRLVRDLNIPVEIRAVPTVRDPDGLALSSRNGRLSAKEREQALGLPRALASAVGDPDPVATARNSLNG